MAVIQIAAELAMTLAMMLESYNEDVAMTTKMTVTTTPHSANMDWLIGGDDCSDSRAESEKCG